MSQNDNEISDLFFQNVPERESRKSSAENVSPTQSPAPDFPDTPVEHQYKNTKIRKKHSGFVPAAAIIFLLAVTFAGVWYVLSHGKNSNTASVNTESLEALFDFSSPVNEAMGLKEISELLTAGSAKLEASVTVSSMADIPEASGIGVRYQLLKDMDKKKASADVSLSYRKAAVLSAALYADEHDICLKIPTLSSGVFTVGSSDIGKQIKKSPLFTEARKDLEDDNAMEYLEPYFNILDTFDIATLFEQTDTGNDSGLLSVVLNKMASVYPTDFEKIKSGITYEEADADASGNKGTKVTVSEEGIELFISDLLTLALDDKDCQDFLKGYFQTYYPFFIVRQIEEQSFDDFMEQIFSRLRIGLTSAGDSFAEYFNQDVSFTIYKNTKGQLVSLTSENSIETDGETLDINLYITSGSTANPADSMHFRLECSDGDDTLGLELVNSCSQDSEIIKHNRSMIISFNDESFVLNHNRTYNTATGRYEGIIKISEGPVILKLNGTLNKAEKAGEYSFSLDRLDIISENETLFSASGEINISKLEEEITRPSGTEYRIFEMPVDDLSSIMENISHSIDSFENSLSDYGFGK